MPKWHFMHQRPSDTTREPIQGEFFATEAISNTAAALVREGNQNSLDARVDSEKVRVRLFVSGAGDFAAPADLVEPYLKDVWPHYKAKQNGLSDIPDDADRCPFLVCEDFGTTGLCGDPLQWHKKEGVKNGFFTFFRAEGQSDKEQGDRGRWGVGKFVFPRSSRVSTFWGVTVRHDDHRRLMMGRAILKSHAIEGQRFVPDGYFGEPQELGNDELIVAPVTDSTILDKFCSDFGLARQNWPGLSIVVPWYDPEITQNSLLRAVIEDYFFPILSGVLEVTVESPEGKTELSAVTLVVEVEKLNGNLAAGMVPLINLAAWTKALKTDDYVQLNRMPETGPPKWTPALFPPEDVASLRDRFHKGDRVAVRVPFFVRPKKSEKAWSWLDVVLERDSSEARDRPVFVREGIIISDIRCPYSRGVRSLVIAEDGPLATMLGDSENPAHTQWQRDGSIYKGKYTYASENLSFVVNSVSEIIRYITEADKEADKSILVDVFSLPADPDDSEAITTKVNKQLGVRPGKKTQPPGPPPPPPSPKRFRLEKIKGGFRVRSGDPDATRPDRLDIRVAYSIRSGNPLKKYHQADFELDKKPITVGDLKGIAVTAVSGNEMKANVTDQDFLLSVTGFDENRDLFVKVIVPQEDADGDQTP